MSGPSIRKHDATRIATETVRPGVGFDFARSFDQTVAKLKAAGCNRLIIDLRGNPGGGLGSLLVMSYLVPDRRPTGYSLTRKGRGEWSFHEHGNADQPYTRPQAEIVDDGVADRIVAPRSVVGPVERVFWKAAFSSEGRAVG